MPTPAPDSSSAEVRATPSGRRRLLRGALGVVALGLLVWAVAAQREELAGALAGFRGVTLLGAGLVVLAGLVASMLSWRSVLAGLGSRLSFRAAARIYFLAQLGKYLPGSVWPMLAQVELGRDHGVPRIRSGVAGIAALVVGLVVGTVVGTVGLAAGSSTGRSTYVWVLVVVPLGALSLWPPVLQRLIGLALRLARRPQPEQQIQGRRLLASAGWALLMWLFFGVQTWLLARNLGAPPAGLLVLCCGAYAISWVVGFLVVFAPAGAGPREAALVLTLAAVLSRPDALALALVSRALMIVGDLLCVGAAPLLRQARRAGQG